jgi:sulfite reductase alpha subunit-like flavoprotein
MSSSEHRSFLENILWSYHGAMPFTLIPLILLLLRKGKKSQPQIVASLKDTPPQLTQQKEQSITILYSTTTGTARNLSEELLNRIQRSLNLTIRVMDLKDYDTDNLENEQMVFFICSTWTDGTLALSSHSFMVWLEDLANDFRISKMYLGKLKYAIFGLGGEIYGDNFCKAVSLFPLLLTSSAHPSLRSSHANWIST